MGVLVITNLVNGNLQDTYAEFENQGVSGQDLGECFFELPQQNSQTGEWYIANIAGQSVSGVPFSADILIIEDDFEDFEENRLNPTKVFWYIYKKLKSYLCPSCTNN